MQTETSTPTTPATRDPGWRRLGVVAAAVMGLWSIALQVVAGAVIPPVLVVGVLFVGLALAIARVDRRWVAGVAAVLPLAALAGNVPPIVHDLSHPEESLVFALTVVSVVAPLLTSLAGVMVWLRRGTSAAPAAILGTGIVVVAAVVGLVAASGIESVGAEEGDVSIETRSVEFAPTDIRLGPDATGVWVDNADPFAHTFTVDGTDIALRIPGSSSQRVDVDLDPGTYTVFCEVPGQENMTATLVVEG